ncbi:MAG: hypothetical protein EAZ19_25930, partial [Oscillatoriales cyanobacterium]
LLVNLPLRDIGLCDRISINLYSLVNLGWGGQVFEIVCFRRLLLVNLPLRDIGLCDRISILAFYSILG